MLDFVFVTKSFQEARVNLPHTGMARTTSLGARPSEIRPGKAGKIFVNVF